MGIYIFAAIVIAFLATAALYCGLTPMFYTVETDRIDKGKRLKILLLSDLHNSQYGKDQCKLIQAIKEMSPHVIMLAGDMVDNNKSIEIMLSFFKSVEKLNLPVFYSTGNHEMRMDNRDAILEKIEHFNLQRLNCKYVKLTINDSEILVGGIDDPINNEFWESDFKHAFDNVKDEKCFRVLISHRPEKVKFYNNSGFDLVLSGHAHGGQVRIPKLLNGLYAPHQGFFPKYAGGSYCHSNYTHIVSRGASRFSYIPRVFNPPEIILIDIVGV